jgi:predicted nucleotidyltransferase
MRNISEFLNTFRQWTVNHTDIIGAALVGSYARAEARDDSDVDLVMICETPQTYLRDHQWLYTFGQVARVTHEDWGLVHSKRVVYENGLEVEFGITSRKWVKTDPIDEGTRRVIMDGMVIITDRQNVLNAFINAMNEQPKTSSE